MQQEWVRAMGNQSPGSGTRENDINVNKHSNEQVTSNFHPHFMNVIFFNTKWTWHSFFDRCPYNGFCIKIFWSSSCISAWCPMETCIESLWWLKCCWHDWCLTDFQQTSEQFFVTVISTRFVVICCGCVNNFSAFITLLLSKHERHNKASQLWAFTPSAK